MSDKQLGKGGGSRRELGAAGTGGAQKGPGLGAFGNYNSIPSRYLFGSPEEVNERVNTNYVSGPEQHPSVFEQIRPGPQSSDINSRQPTGRSGHFKFGDGRRYA